MIILTNPGTADKVEIIRSSAASIDTYVAFADRATTTPFAVDPLDREIHNRSSAATDDLCAGPASGKARNVKTIHIRNKDASLACDVTVRVNANGTVIELHKVTLGTGDMLEYVEGVGFFTLTSAAKLNFTGYVSADVVNATTSFADVTGLTIGVKNGKKYAFLAHLIHQTNTSTTGARFGVNGPAMTNVVVEMLGMVTTVGTGASTPVFANGVATALDTAPAAETTGPGAVNSLAILSGGFEPSADGTFAVRSQSEVAVAAGLTVKRGSWLRCWETDN